MSLLQLADLYVACRVSHGYGQEHQQLLIRVGITLERVLHQLHPLPLWLGKSSRYLHSLRKELTERYINVTRYGSAIADAPSATHGSRAGNPPNCHRPEVMCNESPVWTDGVSARSIQLEKE